MFEVNRELTQLQEQVQQISEERETTLDKKRDMLKRECR
jgi:hypothetical protein